MAGAYSDGSILSNMAFQGTVWGPSLWNVFVGDAAVVFESAGFTVVMYADDVNAFKAYPSSMSNACALADMKLRQAELHRWGLANRVTFGAGKEKFAVLSTTDAAAENFKVLGLLFDPN